MKYSPLSVKWKILNIFSDPIFELDGTANDRIWEIIDITHDLLQQQYDDLTAEIADLQTQLKCQQKLLNTVQHALKEIQTGRSEKLDPDHHSDGFKELAFAVNDPFDAVSQQQGEKDRSCNHGYLRDF